MKTTDLIPLILLELKGADKYGLEITKSIEKRSSGRIKIKQPFSMPVRNQSSLFPPFCFGVFSFR